MSTTVTQLPTTPIQIKKVTLWRREILAHPDALANALKLIMEGGINLSVILRYRHPTDPQRAFVEIYPQPSANDETWASYLKTIGFAPRRVPVLLIEGGSAGGAEQYLTNILVNLQVKIMFLATQIVDGQYGATIGFETDEDAEKAVGVFMRTTTEAQGKNNTLPVTESNGPAIEHDYNNQ
jgi:hypothetical protein